MDRQIERQKDRKIDTTHIHTHTHTHTQVTEYNMCASAAAVVWVPGGLRPCKFATILKSTPYSGFL